jgi:hypothetical protein
MPKKCLQHHILGGKIAGRRRSPSTIVTRYAVDKVQPLTKLLVITHAADWRMQAGLMGRCKRNSIGHEQRSGGGVCAVA